MIYVYVLDINVSHLFLVQYLGFDTIVIRMYDKLANGSSKVGTFNF